MSANLQYLKGNLQTLYAAAHYPTEEPMLSADWSGANLLLKGVGLTGWFFSQVYEKSARIGFENPEQEKIQAALLFTRTIFSQEQELAIAAQMDYQALLQLSIRDVQVPHERMRDARETLTAWHSSTNEWTKFLKSKDSKEIRVWLNTFSEELLEEPRFFSREALNKSAQLRQFFKIITVEGCLEMPFAPLLFKAACSQPLEDNDLKNLKVLRHKIDKHREMIGVRNFEKALKSLNEIFKSEDVVSSLVSMKMALIDAKCEIFFQRDEKHFIWRNTLTQGMSVQWGERELTLGEQLGEKIEPEKDRNRVFEVVDDDSIVLSFGVNRALHDLRVNMRKKFSWALKSVKCVDVEAKGRFAVIKRLKDPITHIKWQSQTKLVEKDVAIATPIANLVACLLQRNKMFVDLSADDIMFNEKGRLTYLKLPLEGPLNFNSLVSFTIKCANENPLVYKFLITKLKEHPYAVFYEKMVENALKKIPDTASNYAAVLNTTPFFRNFAFTKHIFDLGKSLHDKIKDLKKSCLEEIRSSHSIGQRKDVPDIIANAILICYRDGGHIGLLPENFALEVLKLVRQRL
ncbi:MAG: hypothetical protein H0T62_13370 [Parachlamydiaceae bacterium]|nr:hypothetical protein [Parachlamydiaceae bacterium]